jgi:hypothetical protein
MTSGTPGIARAAGADLYFEQYGSGPALLIGGGGDCGYDADLAGLQADEFTLRDEPDPGPRVLSEGRWPPAQPTPRAPPELPRRR